MRINTSKSTLCELILHDLVKDLMHGKRFEQRENVDCVESLYAGALSRRASWGDNEAWFIVTECSIPYPRCWQSKCHAYEDINNDICSLLHYHIGHMSSPRLLIILWYIQYWLRLLSSEKSYAITIICHLHYSIQVTQICLCCTLLLTQTVRIQWVFLLKPSSFSCYLTAPWKRVPELSLLVLERIRQVHLDDIGRQGKAHWVSFDRDKGVESWIEKHNEPIVQEKNNESSILNSS